jgi:hypothetical protein
MRRALFNPEIEKKEKADLTTAPECIKAYVTQLKQDGFSICGEGGPTKKFANFRYDFPNSSYQCFHGNPSFSDTNFFITLTKREEKVSFIWLPQSESPSCYSIRYTEGLNDLFAQSGSEPRIGK